MTAPTKKSAWLAATIVTTMLATGNPVSAKQFKRTELQRHDLTGTNMEVIVATVEAPRRDASATFPLWRRSRLRARRQHDRNLRGPATDERNRLLLRQCP